MYPDEVTLMEVGRIAIAAGRLDAALGALWWHLGPDLIDETSARTAPAGRARRGVRELAPLRLDEEHTKPLLAFIDEIEEAQRERNDVLHSNWLLRGSDAMRPVSEFLQLPDAQRASYLEQWDREAKASDDWQRQPSRRTTIEATHTLDELVSIERRLREAETVAVQWHFRIASMREAGVPPGWRGPQPAGAMP